MFTHYWDFLVDAVVGLGVALWAGSLCLYHAQLLWRGTTTNEDIKGTALPARRTGLRNVAHLLLSPVPASFVAHCVALGYTTQTNTPPALGAT